MKGFKDFILRGNLIELAVAFIVGAAFATLVKAFTEVIIELEDGFIFVTGISDGSSMAVIADGGCDVGLVGYEMARLVERCGSVLTPMLRAELQGALAR